jgi:2-methylcitrate dehydratase PrpD
MPESTTAFSLVSELGELTASFRLAAVPEDVVERSRFALLDTVAAMVSGTRTREFDCVRAALGQLEPTGTYVAVPGHAFRTGVRGAALAGGTAAHAEELDDYGLSGHPGAVVVPAALAAAQLRPCSGSELLEAIVVGYEAADRVTAALGGYQLHNAAGWHSTATCGVFGAAAAAAKVLKLDAELCASTLAVAGSYMGGTWAFLDDGSSVKRLHAGKSAAGGLEAALLASSGIGGPRSLFESEFGGLVRMHGATPPSPEVQNHATLAVLRAGIKRHASCRATHGPVDAVLAIRESVALQPEDIAQIAVTAPVTTAERFGSNEPPGNTLAAQLSIPYCVAVAALRGDLSMDGFDVDQRTSPEVQAIMAKVVVTGDPTMFLGEEPSVRVTTNAGAIHSRAGSAPVGDPANPMSNDQIELKFEALVRPAVGPERFRELLDTLVDVRRVADIGARLSELSFERDEL